MAGRETKVVMQWGLTMQFWIIQFLQMGYFNCLRWVIYLILVLTPTLWSPREFLFFQSVGTAQPYLVNDGILQQWQLQDADGRCLTWQQKRDAISTSASAVSGWYGPGAYIAWLLTAFVTASSAIWHANCAPSQADAYRLDGELLLTLTYPLVAAADVVLRLARCHVDPGLSAAVFVLLVSVVLLGPASRLSWQVDGEDGGSGLCPRTTREWAWKIVRFLCHSVLFAVLGEPYGFYTVTPAVYGLLTVVLLYSEVRAEFRSRLVYRPRAERLAMFVVVQVIFAIVLRCKGVSLWPATGASLTDLDQAAGLFMAIVTLLWGRQQTIRRLVREYNSLRLSRG